MAGRQTLLRGLCQAAARCLTSETAAVEASCRSAVPRSLSQYAASTSFALTSGQADARSYGTWKKIRTEFPLPENVAKVLDEKLASKQKVPEPQIPPPSPKPMLDTSRRVGCLAVKAGMTHEWDEWGVKVPLTVLWVDDCQVVGLKFPERNNYWALQVGAGYLRQKSADPTVAAFYYKKGLPCKNKMVEFPVTEDAVLPVGTQITAAHFVPGQRVDVTGNTNYKGFQGVMKRWGFKGLPASHGVSIRHRHPGAIGGRQDPGRVWKGKKLPGHMGDERITQHNCLVYKVDPARNLVYIRGQVPGPSGQFLMLRDAFNVTPEFRRTWNVPFPTFVGSSEGLQPTVFKNAKDPYKMYQQETDYFPIEWKKGD